MSLGSRRTPRPARAPRAARLLAGVLAPALLLLGACSEAAAPEARPSEVRIRAYIDVDASGSFTTGDQPVANQTLALLRNDASSTEVAQVTTDASGVAVTTLTPGSYTLRLPTTAPAGTVLTSGDAPRIAVGSLGSAVTADVRYAYLPGTISGRIFRDDNANGVSDATDTPGAGLYVVLRRDNNGAPGARVDSVVTDATGAYRFQFLAPGTYYTTLENPTSINYGAAGATRQVVVTAGATQASNAIFTGALIADIAIARTRANGAFVAIQGNVSARPGSFTSGTNNVNSEIWVQDATGGIAVFSVPTADSTTLQLGDRVEVAGTISTFSGQKQIANPSLRVTRLGSGTPVPPLVQTREQAAALTNEGRLVTIPGLRITSVPTGTGFAFTVTAADAQGNTIQIRAAALGLTRDAFTVGDRYSITGILTQFNGTAQLKPRGAFDVAPATATVAAARAAAAGTVLTVSGNLTVAPNLFTSGTNGVNSEIWVQDATGGIAAFSVPSALSSEFAIGDRVELTGTRGVNAGQIQLTTPSLVKVGLGTAPAPLTITGTQANALGANDGRLVTVTGFTVTTVGTGTSAAFNVTGTTPDGATLTVRVSGANTGLTRANFTVGQTYAITGVLTQFNGAAQIKVRVRTDVTP